jgi:hypothetical protein
LLADRRPWPRASVGAGCDTARIAAAERALAEAEGRLRAAQATAAAADDAAPKRAAR